MGIKNWLNLKKEWVMSQDIKDVSKIVLQIAFGRFLNKLTATALNKCLISLIMVLGTTNNCIWWSNHVNQI